MQDERLSIFRQPDDSLVTELRDSLRNHNFSKVGEYPLAGESAFPTFLITHRSANHELAGGVFAFIRFGWMVIDLLWVQETHRRHGLGSLLLGSIEEIGLAQGVNRFRLNTASFQTGLGVYLKHGYEIYAELPSTNRRDGEVVAFTDYYLKKEVR